MNVNQKIIQVLRDINIPVRFQVYSGDSKTYITFFKYNAQSELFSEDDVEVEGHYIQIDIWSEQDYSELEIQVKQLMKNRWISISR